MTEFLVLIILLFPATISYLIYQVSTRGERQTQAELSSHVVNQGWMSYWVYGTELPKEGEHLRMLVSAPRDYEHKKWALVSREGGEVSVKLLE